jgi:hypothetical protein
MTLLPTFTVREFRKATRSSPNQNCVRIARKQGWTAVWDDKRSTAATTPATTLPDTELLLLTDAEFDSYQTAVRDGDAGDAPLSLQRRGDGLYVFSLAAAPAATDTRVELVFDQDEIDAFYDGVRNHEFDHA